MCIQHRDIVWRNYCQQQKYASLIPPRHHWRANQMSLLYDTNSNSFNYPLISPCRYVYFMSISEISFILLNTKDNVRPLHCHDDLGL